MKTTKVNHSEAVKSTAAEKFCKVAEWLKRQNKDFTKHFRGCMPIVRVYNALPNDYNKSRQKVTNYIRDNKNKYAARKLAMFINVEFGFRYFDNVPKEYTLKFGLVQYGSGSYEVHMTARNNWTNNETGCGIMIKDLGNAKQAFDRLVQDHQKDHGEDYEITYIGSMLKEAFKQTTDKDEEMRVGYDVVF